MCMYVNNQNESLERWINEQIQESSYEEIFEYIDEEFDASRIEEALDEFIKLLEIEWPQKYYNDLANRYDYE